MAGLLDLAERMKTVAAGLEDRANTAAIRTGVKILTQLVEVTPVDESTALSNWQVGIGKAVSSIIPAYFLGKRGSTYDVSGREALIEGMARLGQKKPGEPIYISNLLPYIRRLNEGSSSQAPAGFVEAAVMIGRQYLKSIR